MEQGRCVAKPYAILAVEATGEVSGDRWVERLDHQRGRTRRVHPDGSLTPPGPLGACRDVVGLHLGEDRVEGGGLRLLDRRDGE
jgi:hypothetical protein